MPIFYQEDIDDSTRLGIWKIEEDEDFFLKQVPLQRISRIPISVYNILPEDFC
jgi:hypothetical protein